MRSIRIGTKIPAVLPQRVTSRLVRIIKRYHPVWMSLHFMHPDECTSESRKACAMLADGGIPLGSQTVLLKGVNDSTETIRELLLKLLAIRVKPYYLFQADLTRGTEHFRTPVEKGLEIMRELMKIGEDSYRNLTDRTPGFLDYFYAGDAGTGETRNPAG